MLKEHVHTYKVDNYSTRYRSQRYAYHHCTITVKLPNRLSILFNYTITIRIEE